MSKLSILRKRSGLKLREVADRVGVTASTVHDAEVRGIRTPRAALKFIPAFPGYAWVDLLEDPTPARADKIKTNKEI